MVTVTKLVNGVPTFPVQLLIGAKMGDALEMESNAPTAAPVPMPQRSMKAKLDAAAGFARKLRTIGSTCSSAARMMA